MPEKADSRSPLPKVLIKGKLLKVERFDGQNGPIFENLIIIPVQDEFKGPLRLVVKSSHQIAEIDSLVDVQAEIRSRYWRNQKNGKTNYVPELWLAA